MNKQELVESISKKTGLNKADSARALDAFIATVEEAMKKKDKVQLVGFGTFETAKRASRTGKNPRTGEALKIPAKTVVKVRVGAKLAQAAGSGKK